MKTSENTYTFWSLINEHRIEVPIIQRDYAQGRKDKKATQIRETFISAIINSLEEPKSLQLDFIYGKVSGKVDIEKVEKNRKAITNLLKSVQSYSENLEIDIKYEILDYQQDSAFQLNTSFIPLDGQQRLTTLFLLHWYLSNRISNERKADQRLERFTYKTRRSSKDFCKALIVNAFPFEVKLDEVNKEDDLSEQISDASWFFSSWKKDPTVRGMLQVLNEIHKKLSVKTNEECNKLWLTLIDSNIITFEFLDMDKFELTDELYVKMNARGKHLSDFENFKAWLQNYVKEKEFQIEISDWHNKFDIEWTDLFWNHKAAGNYEIDQEYMSFFNLLTLYFFAEGVDVRNNKFEPKYIEFDDNLKKEIDPKEIIDQFRKFEYIPDSLYRQLESFTQTNLNSIFSVLQALEKDGYKIANEILIKFSESAKESLLYKLLGNENSKLNYWDVVYLYAFVKFLILKGKNLSVYSEKEYQQFAHWLRVCKNLVYNTPIDSQIDFVTAIREVNKLSDFHSSIYYHLADETIPISFFSPNQVIEEQLKCQLILENEEWEDEFINYEKHDYFYGQIGFILHFSTINEDYNIDLFRKYAQSSAELFKDKILLHEDYVFQRALLAQGDYLIDSGRNRGLCLPNRGTLRNREENWRKVLRIAGRNKFLKQLIDDSNFHSENILYSLNLIIDKYNAIDWKYYLIKNKEAIRYCGQKLIRWDNNGYDIMLLNSSMMSGYHVEMYSYCFYLNYLKGKLSEFKPFERIDYFYIKGRGGKPCAYIDSWEYGYSAYAIDIKYSVNKHKFKLHFFDKSENIDIAELISNILLLNGFEFINESYVIYLEEREVLPKIEILCESFKQIT